MDRPGIKGKTRQYFYEFALQCRRLIKQYQKGVLVTKKFDVRIRTVVKHQSTDRILLV